MENNNKTSDTPKGVVSSDDIKKAEEQYPLADGSREDQDGGGLRKSAPLGQGGFGNIDEHSGSFSYSIPVPVPPPQNGAPSPEISLAYNSRGTSKPGLVGAGWTLELGKITRAGRKGKRVDFKNNQGENDARDHFVVELNGRSYTLLRLAKENEENHSFRVKIEKTCAVVNRVLSATEKDPLSKEYVIDYWEVYLADGTRYRFGRPGTPSGKEGGELLNKVWNLVEIENPYGHKVVYEYDPYHHPDYPEKDYSYPAVVKCGVTPDGSWDSQVEFLYTDKDMPDKQKGYHDLTSLYTGRRGYTCVIRRRLTKIRTSFRNERGKFQVSREIILHTVYKSKERVFQVEKIEEIPYKGGKVDETAVFPPHRFDYLYKGKDNPALMVEAVDPMGKIEKLKYGLATQHDKEAKNMEKIYLLLNYTEKAGKESWTQTFCYLGGEIYKPFEEYRGHRFVEKKDEDTNLCTKTWYEQNGVHNGYVREQKTYDAAGKLVIHLKNTWMALDYDGGRYMPFIQESVSRKYAEDGKTLLATVVTRIPIRKKRDVPWKYEVDEFGNALVEREITYHGDEKTGTVMLEQETRTTYKNVTSGKYRFIGLPLTSETKVGKSSSGSFRLAEREEKFYNEKGQVIESLFYYDADDREKAYRKRIEYHPVTGKVTKTYRYDGSKKLLVEECKYYESGPYRFLVSHVVNTEGQTEETQAYDLQFRSPTLVVEMNGMRAGTTYDGLGRPVEEAFFVHKDSPRSSGRDGGKTSVRYVYTLNEQERSVETVNLHTGTRTKEYSDSLNRTIKTLDVGYKGRLVEDITEYDHKTRKPCRESEPYFSGDKPPAYKIIRYNDPRLRVSEEIHPGGKVLRYTYDGFKQTTEEEIYERNPDGTTGTLLNKSIIEEETRDALDRIIMRAEGDSQEGNRYEAHYTYDALGRLIKITDNTGAVLRTIDYGSRLDDKPLSTSEISMGRAVMEYDALGHLVCVKQDFKGERDRVCTFKYDRLDRIVEQVDQDTIGKKIRITRNKYDSAPHGIGLPANQEVSEKSPLGEYAKRERYEYDDFGLHRSIEQEWEVKWPGLGISRSMKVRTAYVFDGNKGGRLEKVVNPVINGMGGGTCKYRYDDVSGLLSEVLYDNKSVWKAREKSFTARNEVGHVLLGSGISAHYEYEPDTGLLKEAVTKRGNNVLLRQRLMYDSSGSVRKRTLQTVSLDKNGVEQPLLIEGNYSYDNKNQLIAAREGENNLEYSYKINGSRSCFKEGNRATNYTYDKVKSHQVTQLSGAHRRDLTYDGSGNLVADVNKNASCTRHLEWNPSNRLQNLRFVDRNNKEIRHLRFGYTADNERAILYDTQEDRLIFYVDDGCEVEWRGKEKRQIVRTHISNGARRVATVEGEPGKPVKTYYYHRDYLSSLALITDEKGKVVRSVQYAPFGKITQKTGEYQTDISFTGHRSVVDNYFGFSQYDCKARMYDPVLGVFLSPDPEEDLNNIAFGLNRYVYIANNPISGTDPEGTEGTLFLGSSYGQDIRQQITTDIGFPERLAETAKKAGYDKVERFADTDDLVTKLKGSKHPIILEHGYMMNNYSTMREVGKGSAKHGCESVTMLVCEGGSNANRNAFYVGVIDSAKEKPLKRVPKFYGTEGDVVLSDTRAEYYHTDEKGPKKVDLHRRTSGRTPFTSDKYTRKSQLPFKSASNTSNRKTVKVLKGVGGKALSSANAVMRVKEGYDIYKDVKNGRLESAAKKTLSATIAERVPILGPIVFEAGYAVGTKIHKATGGYVANKVADAVWGGYQKTKSAVSTIKKWWKSLW